MTAYASFTSSILPADHVRALMNACDLLVDQCYDDLQYLDLDDWDFSDCAMEQHLPSKYLPFYTPLFARQFTVCVIVVAWKIAQLLPVPLSCVAEELAMNAVIETATWLLEEDGKSPDFSALEDDIYEDMDFRVLFNPAQDGIENSQVGARLGMGSLFFRDWFRPFGGGSRGPVHPYLQEVPGVHGEPY
jgi:hypothetical protein